MSIPNPTSQRKFIRRSMQVKLNASPPTLRPDDHPLTPNHDPHPQPSHARMPSRATPLPPPDAACQHSEIVQQHRCLNNFPLNPSLPLRLAVRGTRSLWSVPCPRPPFILASPIFALEAGRQGKREKGEKSF